MARKRALALSLTEGERLLSQYIRPGDGVLLWVEETLRKKRDHRDYHRLVQELCLDDAGFRAYLNMSEGQS